MTSLNSYVNKIPNIIDKIDQEGIELPDIEGSAFIGNGNAFHIARLYAMKYNGTVYRAEEVLRLPKWLKVCMISASGGKDSINVCKHFPNLTLLTCNKDAPSKEYASKTIVIPAEKEPPFYNVTTYAGMIYLLERQHPKISSKDDLLLKELNYNSIIFIASLKTHPIASMAALKMREIFGKMALSLTREEAYHGWFLHPTKKEGMITIDTEFELNKPYNMSGNLLDLMSQLYYNIGILQEMINPNKPDYQRILDLRNWKL
ncbi:MAG: hypothetical protein AMQ22_00271 [Candidatus Methanofastidiosum methylothiophilum]|uniref:SIS domain-containing protein n=1 Tax=Candidatus Methanofastidiosum methylothiophilum TaxID=1705564 RepID=A0A150J8F8_9EURY|nr:MAG: hypothetical protein AMQ22_00271 [Candidatus Methanofastidiosum methylthiophilus]